ncbi:MAG: hypothetical protein AB7S78_13125 [Candidatus Omnitrophota bacterium]
MEQDINSEIITILKDLQKRITYMEKKIDELAARNKERSAGAKHYAPSSRTYAGQSSYKGARGNNFAAKNGQTARSYGKKRTEEVRRVPKKNVAYNPTIKKNA